MNGRVRFLLLGGFGVLVVRVASGDRLFSYVNVVSRPYLLAAGATIAVLGTATWLIPAVPAPPRIGALLLVPVAALLLVVPPSQGALVGHRRHGAPTHSSGLLAALRGPDPVTVPLAMVVQRAVWARRSLRGHVLRVVGFVAGDRPGHILLGRLTITCCAADAQEDDVDVRVTARVASGYGEGQWLTVTGRFTGMSPADRFVPELHAGSVAATAAPADPYD